MWEFEQFRDESPENLRADLEAPEHPNERLRTSEHLQGSRRGKLEGTGRRARATAGCRLVGGGRLGSMLV
eukprot:7888216-Alexandrium_andersonii.AAC.1